MRITCAMCQSAKSVRVVRLWNRISRRLNEVGICASCSDGPGWYPATENETACYRRLWLQERQKNQDLLRGVLARLEKP